MIRFFRSKRGQSMVEMALILPLLLLLVAGVIDLARAFNAKISITNAAREGARYGSRYPTNLGLIEEAVERELENSSVPPSEVTIDIVGGGASYVEGQPITVTVTYDLSTIVGSLIGMNEIPMQSATEMVIFGPDWEG